MQQHRPPVEVAAEHLPDDVRRGQVALPVLTPRGPQHRPQPEPAGLEQVRCREGAVGRTEVRRAYPCLGLDDVGRARELVARADAGRVAQVVAVVPRVHRDLVALVDDALGDVGVALAHLAEQEERRPDVQCAEGVQEPRGALRVRSVVEGERDMTVPAAPVDPRRQPLAGRQERHQRRRLHGGGDRPAREQGPAQHEPQPQDSSVKTSSTARAMR